MEESWRRKWKVVRKWNVIVWKGIVFLFSVSWHHSTLPQTHLASVSLKSCPVWFVFVYVLTACVFVTRDTVRHPRRFVFGNLFVNRIVRDPRRSWTEVWLYSIPTNINIIHILPTKCSFVIVYISQITAITFLHRIQADRLRVSYEGKFCVVTLNSCFR